MNNYISFSAKETENSLYAGNGSFSPPIAQGLLPRTHRALGTGSIASSHASALAASHVAVEKVDIENMCLGNEAAENGGTGNKTARDEAGRPDPWAPTPLMAERFLFAAMQPHAALSTRRLLEAAYRRRVLAPDHWRVVAHYGKKQLPPNPDHWRERRAFFLWREACQRIMPLLKSTQH